MLNPKILIAIGLFLVGFVSGYWLTSNYYTAEINGIMEEHTKQMLEAEKKGRELSEKYRELEQTAQKAVHQLTKNYEKELTETKAAVRALRTQRDSLLNSISSYAGGSPTGDSLPACRERATTLGELLGEADQLASELAEAAEQHASEVRVLKRYTEEIYK